jgi:ribonucleoside-diphosphate reductase alpha chain
MRLKPAPDPPKEDTWPSITHRFEISGHKVFMTVAFTPERKVVKLFIHSNKLGSVTSGSMRTSARLAGRLFEHIPLADVLEDLRAEWYEPSGRTNNPEIPYANSISDYIGRWLELKFCPPPINPVEIEEAS